MNGMEMMLAKMLGITPEQMQQTINNAVTLLAELNTRLTGMENKINEIHSAMYPAKGPHLLEGQIVNGEHQQVN